MTGVRDTHHSPRAWRWVLGALGLLLGGTAVLAIVLLRVGDLNRWKPEIERAVADRIGRALRIEGDLATSFWPPGVAVRGAMLQEAQRTGEFARLTELRIGLAPASLFRGPPVVERLVLSGLRLRVVRHADGRMNIDDLLANPAPRLALPAELRRIELSDAQIEFHDEASGTRVRLQVDDASVTDLALQRPAAMAMSGRFEHLASGATGRFKVRTALTLDAEQDQITLANTHVEAALQPSLGVYVGLAVADDDEHWGRPKE